MNEPRQDAEEWLASLKRSIADRPRPKPTRRCRIFGHKWGAWIAGRWHTPNFGATRGALLGLAECKRCGLSYSEARRPA